MMHRTPSFEPASLIKTNTHYLENLSVKQDLISPMFLDWVVLPQLSGDAHFDRWGQKG